MDKKKFSLLISATTGFALQASTAFASATNVKSGIITSSSFPIPNANNDKWSAAVQFDTATAYFAFEYLQKFSSNFSTINEKLHALNPTNILSRGYSIAYREDDQKIILNPEDLQQDEYFRLQTYKGTLRAKKTGEKN